MLLLGQAEAGKLDFRPTPMDLGAFCRRLTDEIRSATNQACPIDLRLGLLPGEVSADERLLRHILTNLLSNAVKYSSPGAPVSFTIERQHCEAVCTIRDRGIGIPEADQAWLFNAFHRGRNAAHVPGTGLGLTIVKRCVELHGGNLSVESALGQGTTMTVRLPLFANPCESES